ncbi:MAG: chromate transporter [Bacteroidales bacterium]|jgi:chromate transporter|nr:chromate transporter [Bacteroidales bacterium]
MIFFQLFWAFFKIGLFGFGGGYAILPMIQNEVTVRYKWIDVAQFSDMIAISQTTPGPISINCATYTGYVATYSVYGSQWLGVAGSVLASAALCLPSLFIIWGLLALLARYRNNRFIVNIFSVLRLAVIGLIFAAAVLLATPSTFADIWSVVICAVSFLMLMFFKKVNPILLIILSGIAGVLIY